MAPGRLPLIGHVHRLIRDLPGFMREARGQHGDFFRVDLGLGRQLLAVGSDVAYELLLNRQVSSDILDGVGAVLNGSIMTMDGARHRRMRKAMAGPFTRAHLDASTVGALIAEETGALLERWVGAESCAVAEDIRALGLNVIFRLIGVEPEDLREWSTMYATMISSRARIPGLAGPSFRARRWVDAELTKILQRCRAEGIRDTLVGALAHGEDEDGGLVDVAELVPSVRLLVLAGYETSATSIGWSLIELAEHPELWARLCAEVAGVERAPRTPTELERLPFTVALGREIMRLYTPATVVLRRTTEVIEIGGHRVEAGRELLFPLCLLNRNPETFPEPDALRPERWLGPDAPRGPAQIVPFGGGPHTCLGMHLAHLEVAHVLVAVTKAMAERGRRPSRRGLPRPRCSWFPTARIPDGTQLWWE